MSQVTYFNGPNGVVPKFNGSTRGKVDNYDFPEDRPGGRVLVTGATGLVGSHVVHRLCLAGYDVHATSRSQQKADDWNAKWPKAKVTWSIIPEQTVDGCYDEAAKGVVGIFHVAGPYHFKYEVGLRGYPTELVVCLPNDRCDSQGCSQCPRSSAQNAYR